METRLEQRTASSALEVIRPGTLVLQVGALFALLCGFGLRLQDLGAQSFWFDEAMSVVFAQKPPSELLGLLVTEDIHPPLYPLLLDFWLSVAGSGEFSARFLSVFAGVALIPLVYVAGKRLAMMAGEQGARSALPGAVGALLAMSSAFYVGYSQETRNYILVTFLGLLSSYLLLRALPSTRRKDWLLYAIATGAAIYTNYTAFMLVVFQAMFIVMSRKAHPGLARRWLTWTLAMLVAYLPWLGFAVDQLLRINDYWPGTLKMGTALRSTLTQLVAGGGAETSAIGLQLLLALGLLGVGLLALGVGASRAKQRQHVLFLLLYFLIPCAVLFAIAYTRPKFDPRYLLVATPAFYLILAWGIAAAIGFARGKTPLLLRVSLPIVGVAALAGIIAVSTVYGEPAKVKADYRSLVSFIEAHAEPGDAVVVLMNAPHPYIYYETKGIPWYPMERVDDFQGAITRLNKLSEEHRRLWFILWQEEWEDPAGYIMHVMGDQANEIELNARFTGLNLRLFELSPNHGFSYYPPPMIRMEGTFGGALDFWGWTSNRTKIVADEFSTDVASGEKIQLDLHWIPQKKLTREYKVGVSLLDSERHEWARVDEVMGSTIFPPTKWKSGEIMHDVHQMQVPVGAPPGDYTLELHIYDPVTLKLLDIASNGGTSLGANLTLGKVHLRLPATPPVVSRIPLFSWQLNGAQIELLSMEMGDDVAVPGNRTEVSVTWYSSAALPADYSARVVLLDQHGTAVAEQTLPLAPGYASTKWRPGEVVSARYWLQLPEDLDKARYWVAVSPVLPTDKTVPDSRLAQFAHVDVVTPDSIYELPSMQHEVRALLGSLGELAGYELSATRTKPGEKLTLTLYWRDVAHFDRSYKVFNHIINDNNVFAGQRDAVPVGDTRPTSTWRKDEVIVDRYEIPVSPDAKPGTYKLKVGMYAEDSMKRLPITGSDGSSLGDSITLANIEVTP